MKIKNKKNLRIRRNKNKKYDTVRNKNGKKEKQFSVFVFFTLYSTVLYNSLTLHSVDLASGIEYVVTVDGR